jgi:hypothetical protein
MPISGSRNVGATSSTMAYAALEEIDGYSFKMEQDDFLLFEKVQDI